MTNERGDSLTDLNKTSVNMTQLKVLQVGNCRKHRLKLKVK